MGTRCGLEHANWHEETPSVDRSHIFLIHVRSIDVAKIDVVG